MKNCNVALHVEELVLDGFPNVDGDQLCELIQNELSRLVAERGVSPPMNRGIALDRLDAGEIGVSPDSTSESLGHQVARAIYEGVSEWL